MAQSILHVVFTPSGAGCLRPALKSAGRDDQVVAFFDNLSFGPINPPDASRARWVAGELGWTGWDEVVASSGLFWREALSSEHRKVAWLSRRSAMEYAGFLEWLWQLGDDPCEVIDLTDLKVVRRSEHGPPTPAHLAVSVAMLPPNEISDNNLFGKAETLSATARREYQALWRQLRAENTPLRVTDGNKLVSAPIDFFDSLLMSYVTSDWQKVAMVVGQALASEMDEHVLQASDLFLAPRVNALVGGGRLELQGETALEMQSSKVRLPSSHG
jgi:hypothetical protein